MADDIWGVNPDTGTIGGPYGNHHIPVVTVKNAEGVSEKFILDPQFSNSPMRFDEYFKATVPLKKVFSREQHPDRGAFEVARYERTSEHWAAPCLYTMRDRRFGTQLDHALLRERQRAAERLGLENSFGFSNPNLSPEERVRLEAQLPALLGNFDERIIQWSPEDLVEAKTSIQDLNEIVARETGFQERVREWQAGTANVRQHLKNSMLRHHGNLVEQAQSALESAQNESNDHLRQQVESLRGWELPPTSFATTGSTEEQIRRLREKNIQSANDAIRSLSESLAKVNALEP